MEINNAWKFSWQYQRAIREMMMNDRILNMLLHSDKKKFRKVFWGTEIRQYTTRYLLQLYAERDFCRNKRDALYRDKRRNLGSVG